MKRIAPSTALGMALAAIGGALLGTLWQAPHLSDPAGMQPVAEGVQYRQQGRRTALHTDTRPDYRATDLPGTRLTFF